MIIIKWIAVVAVCGLASVGLAMSGCDRDEPAQMIAQRTVQPIVSFDGCTVYRFSDGWRWIYFSQCGGGRSNTSWEQQEGKLRVPYQVDTAAMPK